METWYFVAPSDAVAIATLSWERGPFSTEVAQRDQPAALPVRGPQAADDLMRLAPMLLGERGRGLETTILASSRLGQLAVVSRIPDALVAALAALDADALAEVASRWVDGRWVDGRWEPAHDVPDTLAAVAQRAAIAVDRNAGLFAFAYS